MKYLKALGAASVGLLVFAASASATTMTSPAGTAYTGAVKATAGATEFKGSFTTVKCTSSSFEGTVESHGSGVTTVIKGNNLSFSGCNFEVTVKKAGQIIVHATSGGNSTLTVSGVGIVIHTSVGECGSESASEVDIGTGTGGSPSRWGILGRLIRNLGNFLCGSTMEWVGSYTINTPSSLFAS
jgi:hypothetical protein